MPMSMKSFEREVRKQSSNSRSINDKWNGEVLYKGYEGEYHYFHIDPGLGFSRSVKVLKEELDLTHVYPYTDDNTAWLPYSDVK